MNENAFRDELEALINRHSMENGSDTPDFILADYLVDCLRAWTRGVAAREAWYGRGMSLPPLDLKHAHPDTLTQGEVTITAPSTSGEVCVNCGNFTMQRQGPCMFCTTCGHTTGCS
jgi:hypothetical protein